MTIALTLGTVIAAWGGVVGLITIMVSVGAEPRPPGSPLIAQPLVVILGGLSALLGVAGLVWAYGKGRRSMRVRLGGLLAVDMVFVIALMLIRTFAPS